MANDKKFVVKNGLQAQNASLISPDETNTIALTMLDSDTLSFSGDAGQLFSITDSLTGTIFAVNDISGIPLIEVDDDATIRLGELAGNVLIGTAVDDGINKLQVTGGIAGTTLISTVATGTAPLTVASTTLVTNLNAEFLAGKPAWEFGRLVAVTNSTANTDANKYTKVASVTIASQYSSVDVKWNVAGVGGTGGNVRDMDVLFTMKQQSAFGIDPGINLRSNSVINHAMTVGYVIVQNTPTTIVDIYVKANTNYNTMRFTEIRSYNPGVITYYDLSSWEVSDPVGIVAATDNTVSLATTFSGAVTAASFAGDGSAITALSAANISTGTLAVARGGTGESSVLDFKNVLDDQTWTFANLVVGTSGFTSQADVTISANNQLVFDNTTSTTDHIQLYGNGAVTGYGIGVESSTTYYRSNGLHRWYIGVAPDVGVSDKMELNRQHLDLNLDLDIATTDEVALRLNYTTNKATSGNDTGLLINQTDTASPGTSLLIDAQVGATSKFSVDNTGSVQATDILLSAIADTSITSTAVDVFVYDTSQDSDGGAWRERTSHTSWYNETLDTATRGSTREFPAVALIVLTSASLTVYDADDDKLPMWMIFNTTVWNIKDNTTSTAVVCRDGFLAITDSASGLVTSSFISETSIIYLITNHYVLPTNIAERNVVNVAPPAISGSLISGAANDVAMTVLDGAPIDTSTGLPTPTIAVATGGGVSVINNDGTVYDGSPTPVYTSIQFGSDNALWYWRNTEHLSVVATVAQYTGGDAFVGTNYLTTVHSNTFLSVNWLGGTLAQTLSALADGSIAAGGQLGITLLAPATTPTTGMVAYITSLYNSGWQPGDIKGAWLSSTTVETAGVDETTEYMVNGTFDADTDWTKGAGWTIAGGVGVATAVATSSSLRPTLDITTVVGKSYTVSFDTTRTVGTYQLRVHDGTSFVASITGLAAGGTYTIDFVATTTTTQCYIEGLTTFTGTIDNVTMKETGDLITNGTFEDNTTGWTGSNATLTVVANKLRATLVASAAAYAYQTITCVVGESYAIQFDTGAESLTGSLTMLVGSGVGGGTELNELIVASTSYTFTFVAGFTTEYVQLQAGGSSLLTEYMDLDNISVRLADSDRSVNDNGLEVHGEITKAVVAAGAELMAYSGFSADDYLEQPYNADLDFGTGDFYVMGWINSTGSTGAEPFFTRYDTGFTTGFELSYSTGGNQYIFRTRESGVGTVDVIFTSGILLGLHFIVGVRIAGVAYLYIDGLLKNSLTSTLNITDTSAIVRLGVYPDGLNPLDSSSLALMRAGAGAPTAAQIEEIYDTEKFMFQDNANCTLDGASDAITAMGYDDKTELLHVSTSGGRSTFKDLVRVSSDTAADSQSLTAISSQDGFLAEGK